MGGRDRGRYALEPLSAGYECSFSGSGRCDAVGSCSRSIVYNASKLNITSLTIPVLLEWQSPKHRRKAPRFFISGGVVGVVKTISSSKIVYHDADGEKRKKKMDRGMNFVL